MTSSDHGRLGIIPARWRRTIKLPLADSSFTKRPRAIWWPSCARSISTTTPPWPAPRTANKSFEPWEDAGFQGHPHHLLRLPDNRVLLVYGYRHAPMGIRARVLDAECTDYRTAKEIILRDDGGSVDRGYPWATMVSKKRILVVYYFNQNNGPRYIAGTLPGH